jgi:16S rRNA (guanine527-N7)-methyltransferase
MSDQLGALVARYGLDESRAAALGTLVDALERDPEAPTSVTDRQGILDDHIADSLVALELEVVRQARRVADLGAGAGLPGLALAIALPEATVTLLDSVQRKTAFIARMIEACGVANAHAVHTRVEEWTAGLAACDLVTARAVAPLDVVAEYAAPLLAIGGTAVVWRGRRDAEAEAAAATAAQQLGLEAAEPLRVRPYAAAEHRHLQLFTKIAATPSRFPRRAGIAAKRPLGGPRAASQPGGAGDPPRRDRV